MHRLVTFLVRFDPAVLPQPLTSQGDSIPELSFENLNYEWVAVSLRWGTNVKNFTLATDSPLEHLDTHSDSVMYPWKPKNEVIGVDEFDAHAVSLTEDQTITYGNPSEGRVPVDE